MKAKWVILLGVLLFSLTNNYSQSYNTAVGLRLGSEMGITAKQRIGKKTTLEGIVQHYKRLDENTATLLIEAHLPMLTRRINLYTGVGGHYSWFNHPEIGVQSAHGVSLVAGLELTIARMNVSWDYKPRINISGEGAAFQGQSSISVRYVLIKRKSKNKVDLKFWQWGKGDKKKKKKKSKKKNKSPNRV